MMQVLVVEDDEVFAAHMQTEIVQQLEVPAKVSWCSDSATARQRIGEILPDLVLLDLGLPPAPGEMPEADEGETLITWIEELPSPPRIVVLSGRDPAQAIRLLARHKVQDFLSKGLTWPELRARVAAALEDAATSRKAEVQEDVPDFLGKSPAALLAIEALSRCAAADASLLILGETGTGKSLAARCLHQNSPRSRGPLVTVACGALPSELIEAELFGHAAGAFTGAQTARRGRIRSAEGGTLFLDEIGEVPPAVQAKLLRVLEERVVEPLGTDKQIPVNVRLVAATHRNLAAMVREGTFRQDLFFRLRVVTVVLPPLRERLDDLEELVTHFLRQTLPRKQGISAEALDFLSRQPWPGNIRELKHLLESACVHARGDRIELGDLKLAQGPWGAEDLDLPSEAGFDPGTLLSQPGFSLRAWLEEREQELIEAALARSGGVASQAARLLGEKPNSFRTRLRRLQEAE